MNRYLITHSLLSAFDWAFTGKDRYDDFVATLRRIPKEPTDAMMNGRLFEGMVSNACAGELPEVSHGWSDGVTGVARIVRGCVEQVRLSRPVEIDGMHFLLYGVLDGLLAGTIYDIKFSRTYRPGKYWDSTQHPMYFALTPEATEFQYVISDGKEAWKETYYPFDTNPIDRPIRRFVRYLEINRPMMDLYQEHWRARE